MDGTEALASVYTAAVQGLPAQTSGDTKEGGFDGHPAKLVSDVARPRNQGSAEDRSRGRPGGGRYSATCLVTFVRRLANRAWDVTAVSVRRSEVPAGSASDHPTLFILIHGVQPPGYD